MLAVGASASHPEPVEYAVAAALAQRLPFAVFSDGEDVVGVFGEPGDTPEAVQAHAVGFMPWGG